MSLRLEESPYAYVRTVVMRTSLLGKDDYDKLLKMRFAEIARYLAEHGYREEINSLASAYAGAELIERSLHLSMANSMEKLKRISPGGVQQLISHYLRQYDVRNVKAIIRAIYLKRSADEIREVLIPVGSLSMQDMDELLKKASLIEVIRASGIIAPEEITRKMHEAAAAHDIQRLCNAMDKAYYQRLLSFAESLPKVGAAVRELLKLELKATNVMAIIKLRREGFSAEDIAHHLISPDKEDIRLTRSESLQGLFKKLARSAFGPELKNAIRSYEQETSLIPIESALARAVLKKTLTLQHKNPLSIEVTIGYMFAKENEVKNIRTLVKAKQAGFTETEVADHLVI